MTVIDTTRDEWLAWRRQGIGASDVAAILGISPWASPWSVWAEKTGLLPPTADNEAMEAGRWLELAIGPWFADRTGLRVAGEQTWCTHSRWSYRQCTVDGFVVESATSSLDDALGVLEIKTEWRSGRWDEIPAHYQGQGQWQMHVTDMPQVWFAVLHGRSLQVYELARDEDEIAFIVERVDAFWHDHVLTGDPPPTDGSDATARALAAVYPEHTPGKAVEIGEGIVNEWRNTKDNLKFAKGLEAEVANELRALLADAEEGTVNGRRIVSLRSQTRTTTCKHCGAKDTSDPFRVLRHHQSKETS